MLLASLLARPRLLSWYYHYKTIDNTFSIGSPLLAYNHVVSARSRCLDSPANEPACGQSCDTEKAVAAGPRSMPFERPLHNLRKTVYGQLLGGVVILGEAPPERSLHSIYRSTRESKRRELGKRVGSEKQRGE